MVVDKVDLRLNFKRRIESLSKSDKLLQSLKIVEKLADYLRSQNGCWALYSPLSDEPNLLSLIEQAQHIEWVFPKVVSKTEMKFYPVRNLDELRMGAWGIQEPSDNVNHWVEKDLITGCMIPGLSFDDQGLRLGRGGGFYDRYLENYKGLKLGVTFNQGFSEEALPRESHDQRMNIVVSPEKWIDLNKSEVRNGI